MVPLHPHTKPQGLMGQNLSQLRNDETRGEANFSSDQTEQLRLLKIVQHIPHYANESQLLLQRGRQAGLGQRAGNAVEIFAAPSAPVNTEPLKAGSPV